MGIYNCVVVYEPFDLFRSLPVDILCGVFLYYYIQSLNKFYDCLNIIRLTLSSHHKYGILFSQIGKIQGNSLHNSLNHNLHNTLIIFVVYSTYLQYVNHLKVITAILNTENVNALTQNTVQFF